MLNCIRLYKPEELEITTVPSESTANSSKQYPRNLVFTVLVTKIDQYFFVISSDLQTIYKQTKTNTYATNVTFASFR